MSNENAKAIDFYEYALIINEKLFEVNVTTDSDKIDILNTIGFLYLNIGKHSQALEYLLKSLALDRKILGNDENEQVANDMNNIGVCYENIAGKARIALYYYRKALQIYKELDRHSLKHNMNLTRTNLDRVIKKINGTYDEL